jgi:hypothetical protein
VRGVDDGFLYVIDGVPVYERLDGLFGVAPDPAMIESVNVLTGYVPPEFGFKSGGVIEVRSTGRAADTWLGNVDFGVGSDAARDFSTVAGGPLSRTALTLGVAGLASSSFSIRCIPTISTTTVAHRAVAGSSDGTSPRRARSQRSQDSVDLISMCRTEKRKRRPDRISGSDSATCGRPCRGNARGRRTRSPRSPAIIGLDRRHSSAVLRTRRCSRTRIETCGGWVSWEVSRITEVVIS